MKKKALLLVLLSLCLAICLVATSCSFGGTGSSSSSEVKSEASASDGESGTPSEDASDSNITTEDSTGTSGEIADSSVTDNSAETTDSSNATMDSSNKEPDGELCKDHKGGEATCNKLAECEICGEEYGELADHTEKTIEGKEPTCTEGLTDGKVCVVCGKITVEQEVIAARHTYENSYTCSLCGYVFAIESVGLKFELDSESDTYILVGIGTCTDANIVIPYIYNGKAVTSIGNRAFYINGGGLTNVEIPSSVTSIGSYAFCRCNSLTSIEIPSSVTSVGDYAFVNCSSLISITVDENNENYKSVDGNLYSKDGKKLIQYVAGKESTSFSVPDGTTTICNQAFFNCGSLISVELPSSVTSIGDYAFLGCANLASLELPNGMTSVGNDAFKGTSLTYCEYDNAYYFGNEDNPYVALIKAKDTNITSCIVNENTKCIGNCAFYGCASLTSVTIFNNVTGIGDFAFSRCSGLVSVEIPSSVTSIGKGAFYDCISLISIELPSGVTSITESMFYGCSNLVSIELPSGVTSIGRSAFHNCDSLISIELSSDLVSIGDSAFHGCYRLANIEMPSGLTSIGEQVFTNCISLTSIKIPKSVTYIGRYAFDGSMTYDSLGNGHWMTIYCEAEEGSEGWNENWKFISPVVWNCDSNDVAENGYVYTIIGGIRYGIKDNVARVEKQSGSIVKAVIPEAIVYKEVNYPVTSINSFAFYGCTNLISIEIPENVTSIGGSVFDYCRALTSISIDDSNQVYKSIDGNLYSKNGKNLIKYAIGKTDTAFIIPEGVTRIESGAFEECSNLTSITMPNTVTVIGNSAFAFCDNLTSIEIPSSVTCIWGHAFAYCDSLTTIWIPKSVGDMGEYVFWDCDNVTIYCESESMSLGWNSNWNPSNCPVVWGYRDSDNVDDGDNNENDNSGSGEAITFDDIAENMEAIRITDEANIEFDSCEGDENCKKLLRECYYDIEESGYSGKLERALYCENEGDGEWWTVIVFECGSEDEANSLKNLTIEYCDEDIKQAEAVTGNVLVIAWSEGLLETAQNMLDVALGNK